MKKVRMIVSAAVVFAVVGSALAFKPASQANVFCYTENEQPSTCLAADKVNYIITTDPGTPNPCVSGKIPYINVLNVCTKASGPRYQEVDE